MIAAPSVTPNRNGNRSIASPSVRHLDAGAAKSFFPWGYRAIGAWAVVLTVGLSRALRGRGPGRLTDPDLGGRKGARPPAWGRRPCGPRLERLGAFDWMLLLEGQS